MAETQANVIFDQRRVFRQDTSFRGIILNKMIKNQLHSMLELYYAAVKLRLLTFLYLNCFFCCANTLEDSCKATKGTATGGTLCSALKASLMVPHFYRATHLNGSRFVMYDTSVG